MRRPGGKWGGGCLVLFFWDRVQVNSGCFSSFSQHPKKGLVVLSSLDRDGYPLDSKDS